MLHSPVFGPADLTSPYLVAMAHQEWRTQETLKKHFRNRPLGRLYSAHRYRPAQPVLSCRTVDVDLSGTRTYRARSADDIIDEQHKVIHDTYINARNVSSAPVCRMTPRHQNNPSALRQLIIQGSRPGNSPSGGRPVSANSILKHVKRRPHTTRTQHTTDTAAVSQHRNVEFAVDPESTSASEAFRDVNQQIRELWERTDARLDQDKFMRGGSGRAGNINNNWTSMPTSRTGASGGSHDRAGKSQWLQFGGGSGGSVAGGAEGAGGVGHSTERSSTAIVDAFTLSRRGEAYHIDGRAGCEVARQLQSGERIRVGVNGSSVNSWEEQHRDFTSSNGSQVPFSARPVPLDTMVPLCWTDQVLRSEVKVIEARSPRAEQNKLSMCESHPVIYCKASANPNASGLSNPKAGNAGYSVKVRTKNRIGLDGMERTTSKITNISIDNKPGDQDDVELSYEDILNINVETKKSMPKAIASELSLNQQKAHHQGHSTKKQASKSSAEKPSHHQQYHAKEVNVTWELSAQDMLVSRPVTALSKMNMEQELELELVIAPGSTSRSNMSSPLGKASPRSSLHSNSRGGGGTRTPSSGRPPPLKPHLHKTSAAVAWSIGPVGTPYAKIHTNPETEYIQFSQQLIGSQEMDLPRRVAGPGGSTGGGSCSFPTAAISSISKHNNPTRAEEEEEEKEEKVEEEERRSESPAFSAQPLPSSPASSLSSSPSPGSVTSPRELELLLLQDEHRRTATTMKPRTTPSSAWGEDDDTGPGAKNKETGHVEQAAKMKQQQQQEEVHYAFNIPTADIVESELDPGELHLEEAKEEEDGG